MSGDIIVALGVAAAVPITGVIGTWAVIKYRLNNHSRRINEKADKELVEKQFEAVYNRLTEIQKDVRILIQRGR